MEDFSFMDDPDFGLAKCFSNAPLTVMPQIKLSTREHTPVEDIGVENLNEIVSDGFCFKVAPCENVSLSVN